MLIMSHFCLPVAEKIEFGLELMLERMSTRIMRKGEANIQKIIQTLLRKRSMNIV